MVVRCFLVFFPIFCWSLVEAKLDGRMFVVLTVGDTPGGGPRIPVPEEA